MDEDGNVGVFDIEDNGPVPVGDYQQNSVNDVLWVDFPADEGDVFKILNLQPEQILPLLTLDNDWGTWEKGEYGWHNIQWMDVIIKIDMTKLDVLKKAFSFEKHPEYDNRPVCLSMDMGLFYVDFYDNKEAVDLLENNHVILEKYKPAYYNTLEDTTYGMRYIEKYQRDNLKFPFYIYWQPYSLSDSPAIRIVVPAHPMKIWQLPKDIQAKVREFPLKFRQTARIQLAEMLPVEGIWSKCYVYDNKTWWKLASSDYSHIYYNEGTNTIIPPNEMDRFIAEGKAEEWDYHKHHNIEDYQ